MAFAGKNELDLLKGQNIQKSSGWREAPGKRHRRLHDAD
jgi:hypothetical protein